MLPNCLTCATSLKDYRSIRCRKCAAMKTFEYKLWREAVFKRDDYTCQMCDQHGGYLEVDHIKSWSQYPELRLAIDNGRTLCRPCHMMTDTWGGRNVTHFRGVS
jgi:5-methylcytosine-specific restriction endonuclease McrA